VATAFLLSAPPIAAQASNAAVERGRYLVTITGCHDCHSPKVEGMKPDLTRALSGRPATTQLPTGTKTEVHASLDLTAWMGPWGYSIAANLTPDAATGLGTRYTEASFITTMRTGKKPNGTPVMRTRYRPRSTGVLAGWADAGAETASIAATTAAAET